MNWILTLLMIALAQPAFADGSTMNNVETIIVNEQLPKAKISYEKIQLLNGFSYDVISEESHELKHELDGLNEVELAKFKARRRAILSQVSRLLSFSKVTNGIGTVENNEITMLKDGSIADHPLDGLAEAESGKSDKDSNLTEKQKISRRHKLLGKILSRADAFLFQNASTAVSSNEFGLDFAFSLGSVIGAPGKYILGGALGIQLIIGFDIHTKKMHFQIKLLTEKATKGITGIFMPIGLTPRIGGYMRATQKPLTTYDITYVPMAPAYVTRSNGMAAVGVTQAITPLGVLSAGTLTFLEAAMAYQGAVSSVTLLDSETLRVKFSNTKKFFQHLKHRKPIVAPSCGSIFRI